MPTTLTVEKILRGTSMGRLQSVGQMGVIPILDDGDASDEGFAPPDFLASTNNYGSVHVRNRHDDRPTIVPTGAGWVTRQYAQDHAVASAALLKAGESKTLDRAMCIQETQGGLIRPNEDDTQMVVLPATLRVRALAMRNQGEFQRLWPHLRALKDSFGLHGAGNLIEYIDRFSKELDQFVAEFEIVPRQLGAIILVGDHVVGIERTPNISYWERIWEPLVRICYGTLALKARHRLGDLPPAHRTPMDVEVKSLAGIARALQAAKLEAQAFSDQTIDTLRRAQLQLAGSPDDRLNKMALHTVASTAFAGQVLALPSGKMPYVSLGAAGA